MRLDFDFTSAGRFLENLGWVRLSNFYSPNNQSEGKFVQKVARTVVAIFVILSAHDLVSRSLPFKIKVIVNGSLCFLISCISLSLLLKGMQKPLNNPEVAKAESFEEDFYSKDNLESDLEDDFYESPINKKVISPEEKYFEGDIKSVKRNLLADFESVSPEDGLEDE